MFCPYCQKEDPNVDRVVTGLKITDEDGVLTIDFLDLQRQNSQTDLYEVLSSIKVDKNNLENLIAAFQHHQKRKLNRDITS